MLKKGNLLFIQEDCSGLVSCDRTPRWVGGMEAYLSDKKLGKLLYIYIYFRVTFQKMESYNIQFCFHKP